MGRSTKNTAAVGDVIIASVKQAIPNAAVKKGDVVRAVVVRTAKEYGRADGSYIRLDRKSTRLNSSHSQISYAVFCLKKKKKKKYIQTRRKKSTERQE